MFSTDPEEFKAKMSDYSTFQRPYTDEMIENLLEVARTNIKNNKENLVREINKAALRRQNKRWGRSSVNHRERHK